MELAERLSKLCSREAHDELRMIMGSLKLQLAELRIDAAELIEENVSLRRQLAQLEHSGAACPRCRKQTYRLERSERDRIFGEVGGLNRTYLCDSCGFTEQALQIPGVG
jgi:predicted RNA-binding Zn-ribbon protein involved in translation (DUF1610 family)